MPADHPLRAIPKSVDEALRTMSREFDHLYARRAATACIQIGTIVMMEECNLTSRRPDGNGACDCLAALNRRGNGRREISVMGSP